ncbi:unnamed protein product [Polarella glacialis]|uniref:Uncharacterized protein n=1 Tax=Polarella glacialis TaxID=89957 RepID=A0A813LG21_POLGL|nr:unnamed protein product [Polarella glacialis]
MESGIRLITSSDSLHWKANDDLLMEVAALLASPACAKLKVLKLSGNFLASSAAVLVQAGWQLEELDLANNNLGRPGHHRGAEGPGGGAESSEFPDQTRKFPDQRLAITMATP